MAQSGYTPIQLYYSTTAAAVPVNTNLASGELAINITDGKLYYKDNTGTVKVIAGAGGAGVAGGSTTQVQYNSSGSLAGSANMTFDGTSMTLGGNPTLSAGTANGVTYLNGSKVLTSGSALTFDGTNLSTSGNYISSAALGKFAKSDNTGRSMFTGGTAGGTTNGAYVITEGYDYGGTAAGGAINLVTAGASSPISFFINGTEGMRLTSTGLGIGTSSPGFKLDVAGGGGRIIPSGGSSNTPESGAGTLNVYGATSSITTRTGALRLESYSNMAADAGTGIAFSARYISAPNDGSNTFAKIAGYKENGTSGNGAGYLAFATCTTPGDLTERLRIASTGAFGLSGANYGTSGQVLTSGGSGAAPTWTTVSGGGSVAGSDTQVQYNNSGAFGASSVFTFNKSSTDPQLNLNGTTSSAVQLRATSATGGPYVGLTLNNSGAAVFWTWDAAAVPLRFVAGGTEVARFRIASGLPDSFQLVNGLSVGNATPASSGAGLTFPATQSASSDANTLDDYEEGSWTPVISDGTNNATMNYQNVGRYTKIGNTVTLNMYVITDSLGSVSGNIRITGLPFAGVSGSYAGVACGAGGGLNITANQVVSTYLPPTNSYIGLYVWNAADGTTNMTSTQWSSDGSIILSLSYRTS